MNVLVLNGSPKLKAGASRFFSTAFKLMLPGCKFTDYSVRNPQHFKEIFKEMTTVDAVVLSVPLYVDGIPSHVIRFLKEAEIFCRENTCKFKLYIISNNGFIEGRQNKSHIEQYKCWCERAGIPWGGAVGIGGGVMLNVIFFAQLGSGLLSFLLAAIQNISDGVSVINGSMLLSLAQNIAILIFIFSGMLFCFGRLAWAVKGKRSIKTMYTRAMIPSFIFLVVSDIFMIISAIFHGRFFFGIYKRRSITE